MMKKIIFLFFCFFIVFWAVETESATPIVYYVDSVFGSDSNQGNSISAPWKTIARVNNASLAPGDSVMFKRGGVWREQLTVPGSGEAGNYITFGAYGAGEKPIFPERI